MKIRKWEIWHTFSTYFICDPLQLDKVAISLVNSGFAEFILHRDGICYWRSKHSFQSGLLHYDLSSEQSESNCEIKVLNNEKLDISDYAMELLGVALQFKFSELRIYNPDMNFPPPYLRIFLSPCRLVNTEWGAVDTYPMITLYENGVYLIQFRILGPDSSVELENFIKKYVNLFQNRFENIFVPISIANLASFSYYLYSKHFFSPFSRYKLLKELTHHSGEIKKLIDKDGESTFSHEFVPLIHEYNSWETITSLAQTLFHIFGYLVSLPNSNLRFLLLGNKKLPILGNYWIARPHVHLISFDNQAKYSSKNEKIHGESFGWILARNYVPEDKIGRKYLPSNLRSFEDYLFYISSAASLFVWSKQGLRRQQKFNDPNNGSLIYENQFFNETLDYGYMLHRSILESSEKLSKLSDILEIKKYLSYLKNQLPNSSHFGDIRELLIKAWQFMGVDDLRMQINENLKILEIQSTYLESKKTERFTTWITLLIGLLAIPQFAQSVVNPLWYYLKMSNPKDPNWESLYFIFISFLFFSIIICIFLILKRVKIKSDT